MVRFIVDSHVLDVHYFAVHSLIIPCVKVEILFFLSQIMVFGEMGKKSIFLYNCVLLWFSFVVRLLPILRFF